MERIGYQRLKRRFCKGGIRWKKNLFTLMIFFDFLEQNGIDASLINVVNCEIDSSQETKGKLIVGEQRHNIDMEEIE